MMGIWTMALPGTSPITSPVVGWVADAVGPRESFGLSGVALLVTVGLGWRSLAGYVGRPLEPGDESKPGIADGGGDGLAASPTCHGERTAGPGSDGRSAKGLLLGADADPVLRHPRADGAEMRSAGGSFACRCPSTVHVDGFPPRFRQPRRVLMRVQQSTRSVTRSPQREMLRRR